MSRRERESDLSLRQIISNCDRRSNFLSFSQINRWRKENVYKVIINLENLVLFWKYVYAMMQLAEKRRQITEMRN